MVDSPMFRGGVFTKYGATRPARAPGARLAARAAGRRACASTSRRRSRGSAPGVARPSPRPPAAPSAPAPAVIALNAWASTGSGSAGAITVRGSYIVLTAPAPDKLEEIGWTDGMGLSDYRAALHYLRTTPDGRIAFGIGGMQPTSRATSARGSPTTSSRSGWRSGPPPDVPDVPRRADRRRVGRADRRRRRPPAVLRHARARQRALRHGVHGQRRRARAISAVGSWRIARWRVRRRARRCRSSTLEPLRFPPEPIRSPGALVANQAIRRKDEALEDRGADRTRSWTSWRSCRGGWATTSALSLRRRAARAAHGPRRRWAGDAPPR